MHRIFILLLTIIFNAPTHSQSLDPPDSRRDPSSQGIRVDRSTDVASDHKSQVSTTSSSIDSFFTAYMSTYHIPGLAACIVKKNRIAWQGYYGFADLAHGKTVTDSTVFLLAATSKTITSTALMQLYDAGGFRLDDSINPYLPFPVRNPYHPEVPITFRMLLTHTSSIRDNWDVLTSLYVTGDSPIPLGTFLREYLKPGGAYFDSSQNFHTYAPGSAWDYFNVGAALCGYLVETISGIPFDLYCKANIFTPLQMTGTSWFLKGLNQNLIARPYTFANGSFVDQGLSGYPDYPDGQLRTTVPSLARFLLAHINGGKLGNVRILDSATVRLMRTPYVTGQLTGWVDSRWGLLWIATTDIDGKILWGHTGGDTVGVETAMFLSEQDSTGVILLANRYYGADKWKDGVRRLFAEAANLTVGVEEAPTAVPERVLLHQNYPNPFNPKTEIRYQISDFRYVTLAVYDLLGREVAVLVNEAKAPGVYQVTFDATGLASGVYLYRMSVSPSARRDGQGAAFVATRRFLLIR